MSGAANLPIESTPFSGPRRAYQLVGGLVAFALSMAMMVHSGHGNMPWDVLHQGLVRRTGLPYGVVITATALLALSAWIPLRQRPGIGTVANVIVIGVCVDPFLALLNLAFPTPTRPVQVVLAIGGIVLNGVATAAYIGARLGPGPRDGLMTGLVAWTGWHVRRVKTLIELAVIVLGWLLGGEFGWATVGYVVTVGVVVQGAAHVLAPDLHLSHARTAERSGATGRR